MAKKILIIDDEVLVTGALQKLLKKEGYEVVVANNGEEAIKICKENDFDLIISDVRMPKLNGIETIEKIRLVIKENKRKKPKEMFITGFADQDKYEQAINLGVKDYIFKPFDTTQFLEAVRKKLNES